MTSDRKLFRIALPGADVSVEVSGPVPPPDVQRLAAATEAVGYLAVQAPAGHRYEVHVSSNESENLIQRPATDTQARPLFEQTRYFIYAQGPIGSELGIEQENAALVTDLTHPGPHKHLLSGTVNFRSRVGRASFDISLDAEVVLRFTLEVFPLKVDYKTDFEVMKSEVDSAVPGLAFDYLRGTTQAAKREFRPARWSVEWVNNLDNEIDELVRAFRHIERFPYRDLERTITVERVSQVRKPSRQLRRAVRQGKGYGQIQHLKSGIPIRSRVPHERKAETLNTPEHRWLLNRLRVVMGRLTSIAHELEDTIERFERLGRTPRRQQAQLERVRAFGDALSRLTNSYILQGVSGPSPRRVASLTLAQAPGYREASTSLENILQALSAESDHPSVGYKDVSELYQVWCFLAVVESLRDILGVPVSDGDLFEATEYGLRIRLRAGKSRTVKLELADGTQAWVQAEPTFHGPTGSQVPDIVLSIRHKGWPALLIVFDAKYRIQADDGYVSAFGGPGPPIDAVNSLHRYRDAIAVEADSRKLTRPVVRGAALFPSSQDPDDFRSHSLRRSLDVLGIGALPFLPSSRLLVQEWIEELLTEPVAALAEPGPSNSGLSEKARRGIPLFS